jgi:RNA polymerase sigma-70 factor (ECF subfamily)
MIKSKRAKNHVQRQKNWYRRLLRLTRFRMTPTSTSLIHRVRDTQDAASWAEFVELYEPLLLSYVRSRRIPPTDVRDIVQEIFIKLLRSLPKFTLDHERGRFRTWLYQVTISVVIDQVRRRMAERQHLREWWEQVGKHLSANGQPGEDWTQALHRRVLTFAQEKVKAQTHPKTWSCYEQHLLRGRGCAEIASELDITANAVSQNAGRVLEKIKALCTDYLEDLDDE